MKGINSDDANPDLFDTRVSKIRITYKIDTLRVF